MRTSQINVDHFPIQILLHDDIFSPFARKWDNSLCLLNWFIDVDYYKKLKKICLLKRTNLGILAGKGKKLLGPRLLCKVKVRWSGYLGLLILQETSSGYPIRWIWEMSVSQYDRCFIFKAVCDCPWKWSREVSKLHFALQVKIFC